MNILITGANGYLGRELTKWLLNNSKANIYALDKHWDNNTSISNERIKRIKVSLDNLKAKNKFNRLKIDFVVHLAAKVSIDICWPNDFLELMQQNCMNLVRLLEWTITNKVNNFLFISSMTVYAPPKNGIPQNEDHPKKPISGYGLSKLFGEEIVKMFAKQANIRSIILRLPGLYGGKRKAGLLYNIAVKIKRGETVDLDLKNLEYWETMHVSDAAEIIGLTIMKKVKWMGCEEFNVGYEDRRIAIRPLINLMQKYYHSKPPVIIKNEHYYKPFSMRTGKIRKYLRKPTINYVESLNHFLEKIE